MSEFQWPARVYMEDTDAGGVVFYANYLKYFERARTEWLRARGLLQTRLATDPGLLFVVAEVHIRYRRPARLDDQLLVSCAPRLDGAATLLFAQRICREGEREALLAEADVRVVSVGSGDFRPRRLPPDLLAELQ